MYYFIGRDIDGDGYPEFVTNLETMALTEDPSRALQFTARELEYLDMPYLNSFGFYAIEAPRYGIPQLMNMLFRPTTRSYRPRVAPPPRRVRPPRGPVPMGNPLNGPRPVGRPMNGPGPIGGPGPHPMNGPMGPGGPGRRGPGGGRGPGGMGFGR